MKIDVIELLKERCNYPLSTDKTLDGFIDTALANKPDRCWFITTEGIFRQYYRKNDKIKEYYVTAVFDMSTAYMPYMAVKMSLFVLSKKESSVIKTGVYNGEVCFGRNEKKNNCNPTFELSSNLTSEYIHYCELINQWINKGGETPKDTEHYSFNAVNRKSFDSDKPFASKHTKQVFAIYEQLEKEDTIKLSEIADIIIPKKVAGASGFTISAKCLKYPFDKKGLNIGTQSNSQIFKGDIISFGSQQFYLITEELENVYANTMMRIIRPHKQITPEYLFIYLNSETSKIILDSLSMGTVIKHLSTKELSEFPVITPPSNTQDYKELFKVLYNAPTEDSINELTKLIVSLKTDKQSLESSLLEEQSQKLKLIKDPKVRKIILDDVKELITCYEHNAYKATLTLAGSILEAFLIDWLGSIHSKDYFNEKFFVADRRDKSRTREANLIDYIDAIADIKKPDWMEEQGKAHHIREKRNMVHAKLCMMKSKEINEKTCKQVIDYLIEIISTRYKNLFI